MKLAPDQMGTVEARAMLDQLPGLYFAVLLSARIEQHNPDEVRCSFELPILGKRTMTGPTALAAIRAALLELADTLTLTSPEALPKEWRSYELTSPEGHGSPPAIGDDKGGRIHSKSRQLTIGVTMPATLKAFVQKVADQQGTSFAEVARQLASVGFEEFDERTYSESSAELFSALSAEVRTWQPADTEQVMIRLDPKMAVRIRATAKEHRRSVSEFGAMCLAHGLIVLEKRFSEIATKVATYVGPASRQLAPKVGLGANAQLLSGILVGSIRAPKRVLAKLSEILGESELALSEFFKNSFVGRTVPAFKSGNVKPQISTTVISWEDAVRSLRLPAAKTKELLQLDE